MNKYIKSFLVLTVLLLTACGEDFLDRPPYGILTNNTYYKTPDDAYTALTACYSFVAGGDNSDMAFEQYELGDMTSDDAWKGGESDNDRPFVNDLAFFRAMSNNQVVEGWWMNNYQGIFRINSLLEALPDIEFSDAALKVRYDGEARFLRAYLYLNLVRVYGDIPLVDQKLVYGRDEINLARTPAEQIHQFLRTELTTVAATLPPKSKMNLTSEWGRASQGAAYGLLARVELFFKSYTEARDAAKKVIDSGDYSLEPQYGDLFFKNDLISEESIFEMLHANTNGNGDDIILPTYYRSRGVGGWGFLCPTKSLVDEFEVGDPRLLYTITETGDKFPRRDGTIEVQNHTGYASGDGYHSRKMFYPEPRRANRSEMDLNKKEIRYADVLLMYAEALIESDGSLSEACDYINQVRDRARKTYKYDPEAYGDTPEEKIASRMTKIAAVDIPDVKPTSKEEVRAALRHERRVELATESRRLYDLRRWGWQYSTPLIEKARRSLASYANWSLPNPELRMERYPIPQSEIDRTFGVIKQNEGW
ncbi:membrane protein [Bacteroidia bacterium]|nr:membrane protein [Bacteroidia bacterium]GHU59258.1 membrane protein [Bacteroidia bacterium]